MGKTKDLFKKIRDTKGTFQEKMGSIKNINGIDLREADESAVLNMPANLEISAVATGLEKVSFHSNPKERQCQRLFKLPHNCTHPTH